MRIYIEMPASAAAAAPAVDGDGDVVCTDPPAAPQPPEWLMIETQVNAAGGETHGSLIADSTPPLPLGRGAATGGGGA